MRMILGILALTGNVVFLLFILILWSLGKVNITDPVDKTVLVGVLITLASSIYFISFFYFGKNLWTEDKKIELQNRILKKKIEQEQLKKELMGMSGSN
jgi:hypothetical protein